MKDKIDLSKKDEKIKKESAFIDLLTMEINKKIIGQKKMIGKTPNRIVRKRTCSFRRSSRIS